MAAIHRSSAVEFIDHAASIAAGRLFRSIISDALTPRPPVQVDEWADASRILPAMVSGGKPGRYRSDFTPYVKRPLRLYNHAAVNFIALMWASQTSKSETLDTCKLYTIAEDPANMLVMAPNIEDARDYNQDRFIPSLHGCRSAHRHLLPSPRDMKTLKIRFDNLTAWFRGSNSKSGRRSKIAHRVFCDEIDSYEGSEWKEVFQRVKGGSNRYKIVLSSTPDHENAGIHAEYQLGSQEKYFVPCPHCGTYQELIFSGLVWDGGSSASKEQARATARYRCQHKPCSADIYEAHKPAMLRRGLWVPASRTIEDVIENGEGSLAGGVEGSYASFHLSSLYSPFPAANWGNFAWEFANAGYRMNEEICRGWLGQPWIRRGERLEENELAPLCIPETRGGYRLGEVPDGVLAITRAIDVQKDRIYVEDRGWGKNGNETWLINFMEKPRSEGNALTDVHLPREYRRKGSNEKLGINVEFIDTGKYTDEIYRYVRAERAKGREVHGVKGEGSLSPMAAPFRRSTIDKWPDGTAMQGGIVLLLLNSDYWKTAVAGRIRIARTAPGQGDEATGLLPQRFHLPDNSRGELNTYLRQLTSEWRVSSQDSTQAKAKQAKGTATGFAVYRWVKRPGRTDNHAWDCLYYNLGGAESVNLRSLGDPIAETPASKTPAPKKKRRGWVSGAR